MTATNSSCSRSAVLRLFSLLKHRKIIQRISSSSDSNSINYSDRIIHIISSNSGCLNQFYSAFRLTNSYKSRVGLSPNNHFDCWGMGPASVPLLRWGRAYPGPQGPRPFRGLGLGWRWPYFRAQSYLKSGARPTPKLQIFEITSRRLEHHPECPNLMGNSDPSSLPIFTRCGGGLP